MAEPSRLVSKPVPTPLNEVRGGKAQGAASRQAKPGKGKTGRVNASELLMRLRHSLATEMTADDGGTGIERHEAGGLWPRMYLLPWGTSRTPRPGVKAAPTPIASHSCGTWQPQWSPAAVDTPVSQRQRRLNSPGGKGRPKKRKPAAERHRESITGWIGRGEGRWRVLRSLCADIGVDSRLPLHIPDPKGC
jgi:hypothetical protein